MNRKGLFYLLGLLLMVVWAPPGLGAAADTELENALQGNLQESRDLLARIRAKLRAREGISADLFRLKSVAEEIRISDLLLQERFALRDEKLQGLGSKVEARHRAMTEGYRKALQDYLNLVASLPAGDEVSSALLEDLQILLDKIIPKKRRPILGSLPYRNLQYPLKDPNADPPITPAYLGGNKAVIPEDLKDPSSKAISSLAQSLNWNPVSIYEWVKNNVETEWYFGCMKGAEETLRQKSGNDCDQAALLVVLLRASGFPSRYVRGVIEFFPDINQAKNLTGIDDEKALAAFFQKAGIPFRPVIAGGRIANLQIEHIWVESQIPYSNYRGAVTDGQGKIWLALDTSVKVAGYERNVPLALPQEPFFSEIRDAYLNALQTTTPLEWIQAKLEDTLSQSQPGKHYPDLLRRRTFLPEVMNILPAGLQFQQIEITQEYTEIPPELLHRVRFVASYDHQRELFNIVLDAAQLSNRKVLLTYEPESVEDQATIDLYGGLDNTPAYLVRLRPVLKVDEERIIVAQDGQPMGEDYTLTVEMISPHGMEAFTTHPVTGNLSVLGFVSQKAVLPDTIPDTEKSAERLLYEEALHYIDRWGRAEEELASLMRLSLSRPIPTLVVIGGVIDVTYLLNAPHGFTWKGVYVDAALRTIEVERSANVGDDLRKVVMQLSSLQGSVLEERIFKDDFQVESISTAKLLTLATAGAVPIVTLDRTNIETILPTLSFADEIQEDLRNAVNQGLMVTIPSRQISYLDWSGIGYFKEDLETGESGWMLSGQIAGGESAQSPEQWVNQLFRSTLGEAYAGESNQDPLAAATIIKIPTTDRQEGTVGTFLDQPLSVLVRDKNGLPVKGASVTFRVIAGGGGMGPVPGASTVTVVTAQNGIAKAPFLLGKKTSDNPFYQKPNPTDVYYTQTGLNLVTAAVRSTGPELPLQQPFEEYGLPGPPHHLVKILGDGNVGLVNNPAGSIKVLLVDQDENPISNQMIAIETVRATSDIVLPEVFRSIAFYLKEDCPNLYPLFGDCPTHESLFVPTQYFGVMVNTILGNTVNTTYEVKASATAAPNVAPAIFTLYSLGFRAQSGNYIPPALLMGALAVVNDQGQPVNATKIGTELKAPLVSELFTLSDDYTMEGPYICVKNNQPTSCYRIKTSDTVNIQRKADGIVTYTVAQGGGSLTPAENLGDGKYQSRFTAGITPSVNQIEAGAVATITVPEVLYNPVTLQAITNDYEVSALPNRTVSLNAGQSVRFDRDTRQPILRTTAGNTVYTIYSVDVKLNITPNLVLLNDGGYTADDMIFRYTILPPEYNAISAQIDIFKIDPSNNEIWQGYIQGDRTQTPIQAGQIVDGTAAVVKGSPFNIKNSYQGEAVVNRGSDLEVRSGVLINGPLKRTELPIGQIKILDNETGEPVMGGVTDGATKLKLQLTVKFDPTSLPTMTWGLFDPDIQNLLIEAGTFLLGNEDNFAPPVNFNTAGVAEAIYRAPEAFIRFNTEKESDDKNAIDRAVQVALIDPTMHALFKGVPSIQLKRPPVLLVHGIWASGDSTDPSNYTWNNIEGQLNFKKQFSIYPADYHETNAAAFAFNALFVKGWLKDAKELLISQGFSVTKVDVVVHSMGGLLIRQYCWANPDCNEQIHKLITVDTPFGGSELARLLRDVRDRESKILHPLEYMLLKHLRTEGCTPRRSICRPIGQAVDDLIPGSTALFVLPELSIPTHVIVGLTTDGVFGHDRVIAALWRDGLSKIFKIVPDQAFSLNTGCGLFGHSSCTAFFGAERSDRIVSQISQSGGVSVNSQYDIVSGVDHITVHDDLNVRNLANEDIVTSILKLLNARPDDNNEFIQVLPRMR